MNIFNAENRKNEVKIKTRGNSITELPRCFSGKVHPRANEEDMGFIPGSGRSPGEGNGNPLHCMNIL